MMVPGTIAWASAAPGFSPPSPHPLLIVLAHGNGNVGAAFITHSTDLLRVGVAMNRTETPSAFRERGGPLTDEAGVVALIDDRGQRRVVVAEPLAVDRLRIGSTEISLTRLVQLPAPEWEPLRQRIRVALGLAR